MQGTVPIFVRRKWDCPLSTELLTLYAEPGQPPRQPASLCVPSCSAPAAGPNVLAEAERLRPVIEQYARIVRSDFTGAEDLSNIEADVAIVLGGDGSILRAARQMGHRQIPVAAINLGKLGFLANMSPADLPALLQDFSADRLYIIEHLMFECSMLRRGEVCRPATWAQRGGRPRRHAVRHHQRRSLR